MTCQTCVWADSSEQSAEAEKRQKAKEWPAAIIEGDLLPAYLRDTSFVTISNMVEGH